MKHSNQLAKNTDKKPINPFLQLDFLALAPAMMLYLGKSAPILSYTTFAEVLHQKSSKVNSLSSNIKDSKPREKTPSKKVQSDTEALSNKKSPSETTSSEQQTPNYNLEKLAIFAELSNLDQAQYFRMQGDLSLALHYHPLPKTTIYASIQSLGSRASKRLRLARQKSNLAALLSELSRKTQAYSQLGDSLLMEKVAELKLEYINQKFADYNLYFDPQTQSLQHLALSQEEVETLPPTSPYWGQIISDPEILEYGRRLYDQSFIELEVAIANCVANFYLLEKNKLESSFLPTSMESFSLDFLDNKEHQQALENLKASYRQLYSQLCQEAEQQADQQALNLLTEYLRNIELDATNSEPNSPEPTSTHPDLNSIDGSGSNSDSDSNSNSDSDSDSVQSTITD